MKSVAVVLIALALCLARAEAQCRQALALGLDVSGSVDQGEYRLQLSGLAAALERAEVAAALLSLPGTAVDIAVYEWSGPQDQRLIIPWQTVRARGAIAGIAQALRSTQRRRASPGTALGSAMIFGQSLLAQRAHCWQRTLDLSGDGKPNMGPHPRGLRAQLAGITINALVIGSDAPRHSDHRQVQLGELSAFFRTYVIQGADSFVQTALGFAAYEEAMARKLIRELRVPAFALGLTPRGQ